MNFLSLLLFPVNLIFKSLDYFQNKPFNGFVTSISGWFLGSIPFQEKTISYTQNSILWHLQIFSLMIGCLAGILTIISLIRRKNKKKNEN